MQKLLYAICALAALAAVCCTGEKELGSGSADDTFFTIDGTDLIAPDGTKFFIRGTNLGNWFNPEGYMFGFSTTNSAHFIERMLCELVGPDKAAEFWKQFKDNYITRADIDFIASAGANTIRLPFSYKMFTDEDYMGNTGSGAEEAFARIDSLVEWCRDKGLYLILDMHDAPGGQTGDNIDDSHGYPWLFESEPSQKLFCRIWKDIAGHFSDEPQILGYELMNEPIAPYFDNADELNTRLEGLMQRALDSIRTVDTNHIVLFGAPQWNSNFAPLSGRVADPAVMYTCHRYGGEPTAEAIGPFIAFRDSSERPMYMGEIGHNTCRWQRDFCDVLEDNNIGYTFWPYKKVDGSCMVAVTRPSAWDSLVVAFAEAPRQSYADIRRARPADAKAVGEVLDEFVQAVLFENCVPQRDYITSIKLSIDSI